ncbi:MAG: hypothetical protein HRU28_14020 [Rhizobiales bacterium]|nr:hypothetical protein [Hyphomicrobiales bacterium]
MENQKRAMLQVILLADIRKNVKNKQKYDVIFHLEDGASTANPIYWLEIIDNHGVHKQLINRLAGGEKGYVTKAVKGIGPLFKLLQDISPHATSVHLPVPPQNQ